MVTPIRLALMNSVSVQLLVAGAFMIAGTVGCSVSAEEAFLVSASADGIASLRVDWKNGSVTVRVDENEHKITAVGKKVVRTGSESRALKALEKLKITLLPIGNDPTKLLLSMSLGRNQLGTLIRGDVDVVLPTMLALNIEIGNGTAIVNGNSAASTVVLRNGIVRITKQSGDTLVRVRRGTIKVDSLAGTVDARCGIGEIDVTARVLQDDRLVAHVGIGAIELHVPAETAAFLDLRAGLGEVNASLSDFTVTNRKSRLTSLKATINGGGTNIVAGVGIGSVEFGAVKAVYSAQPAANSGKPGAKGDKS